MNGRVPSGLRDRSGLTLLEVLLATSILAVIVMLLTGTLRVGLRAWEAGQRQATAQQEIRAVVELIADAISEAYPYRGRLGAGVERVILFEGEPEQIKFVTSAVPVALEAPAVPFHATTLAYMPPDRLRMEEKLLPTDEPFTGGAQSVLSRSITGFRLQYRDQAGAWQEHWDGTAAAGLPSAVRVEITVRARGRSQSVPPFVVPIALGKDAA